MALSALLSTLLEPSSVERAQRMSDFSDCLSAIGRVCTRPR
ncbi:Uncharacterised protein [Acinetobacter baumannii]|nr:Uncharacterised protein [Acinetobacter baumannii]